MVDLLTLDNGLRVVMLADHLTPIVSIQVWFGYGSANETEGESGLSHLIEHMVFKATHNRKNSEIAGTVESLGGEINAFTSFDHTVYYINISGRHFVKGMEILADAVQNAIFDHVDLEKEKMVVIEEIMRGMDMPETRLMQSLFKTAFKNHPYARPILGTKENVRSFKREDILAYMDKWHTPLNTVISIAGNFNPKQAKKTIVELFGTWDKKSAAIRPEQRITHGLSPRVKILDFNSRQSMLAIGFPSIKAGDLDVAALDCLSFILSADDSSRLQIRLKEEKGLLQKADTQIFTPRDPGLIILKIFMPEKNIRELIPILRHEIEILRHQPVSKEELKTAKHNLTAGMLRGRKMIEDQAGRLGFFLMELQDVNFEKSYLKRLEELNIEDIQKAAQKYLVPEHISISLIMPKGYDNPITSEELVDLWKNPSPIKLPVINKNEATTQKTVLKNGMTILTKINRRVPLFSICALFKGGQLKEQPGKQGISSFTAQLMTKGTKRKDAIAFLRDISSISAEFSSFSGRNTIGVNGEFLSDDWRKALNITAEILLEPAFTKKEVNKLKPLFLSDIKYQKEHLGPYTIQLLYKHLFNGHPYAFNQLGAEETAAIFTQEDVIAYYEKFAHPENLVIAVTGDIIHEEIIEGIDSLFSNFTGGKLNTFIPPAPTRLEKNIQIHKQRDIKQSHIAIGYHCAPIDNPDRHAINILSSAFNGQGGRLFPLRNKHGLAYTVNAFPMAGVSTGSFIFYIACAPDKTNTSTDFLYREINNMIKNRLSQKELERAKEYFTGNYEMSLETNGAQSMQMAINELYGLGYDFSKTFIDNIKLVSDDDVIETARKYFDVPGHVKVVVGGKI